MINSSSCKIKQLPNGVLVNQDGMSREDYLAIAQDMRDLPLSEEEKLYVDNLHMCVVMITGLLEEILETEPISERIHNMIVSYIEQAELLVALDSDIIGRGLEFEIKRIDPETLEVIE